MDTNCFNFASSDLGAGFEDLFDLSPEPPASNNSSITDQSSSLFHGQSEMKQDISEISEFDSQCKLPSILSLDVDQIKTEASELPCDELFPPENAHSFFDLSHSIPNDMTSSSSANYNDSLSCFNTAYNHRYSAFQNMAISSSSPQLKTTLHSIKEVDPEHVKRYIDTYDMSILSSPGDRVDGGGGGAHGSNLNQFSLLQNLDTICDDVTSVTNFKCHPSEYLNFMRHHSNDTSMHAGGGGAPNDPSTHTNANILQQREPLTSSPVSNLLSHPPPNAEVVSLTQMIFKNADTSRSPTTTERNSTATTTKAGERIHSRRKLNSISDASSVVSKLEKSRQSARDCRMRKSARYQYLSELVNSKERANLQLYEELETLLRAAQQLDNGTIQPTTVSELFKSMA